MDPVTELLIGTGNYKLYKMPSFILNSTRTEIGMHHYWLGTSSMIPLVKGTGGEGSKKKQDIDFECNCAVRESLNVWNNRWY